MPITRIPYQTRSGRDAFVVLGHDSRLGQVINNLLDNSRSFSPPDATVRVRLRRVRGDVFERRPTLRKRDWLVVAGRSLTM